MGIDICMTWPKQTEEEQEVIAAACTVHSVGAGHIGYLRESYHGRPYATCILVPESFEERAPDGYESWDEERQNQWRADYRGEQIPADTLTERLPKALIAAFIRESEVYGDTKARDVLIKFGIEPTLADGSDPTKDYDLMDASEIRDDLLSMLSDVTEAKEQRQSIPDVPNTLSAIMDLTKAALAYGNRPRSLVTFVALARKKERELGHPVSVFADH